MNCPRCGSPLPYSAETCPHCLGELRTSPERGPLDGTTASTPDVPPELGSIGPYRLLALLGEGGMGTVYLAEQREPIRRRVALKLTRSGLGGRQVLARFEAERQALAVMSHPGIAQVFAAGTTATGAPYFVMEFVPGSPIHRYCDEKQLSVPERISLFRGVCAAVQHAHQRGILHRDLKPTNILVESIDGAAQTKVIDFGLAKALHQPLTERTLFTEAGAIVGTPEYMSPEQAGGEAFDVDTTSDVYSLGVVLYELLTGALPFDPSQLRGAGWLQMVRILREQEPKRPSTRVSQLAVETASVVARNRRSTIPDLGRSLRGDLDAIVLKALNKDRQRRYQSVHELSADLGHHLANEPVAARPPSSLYRIGRFVRRHRFGSIAAGALFVVTSLGTAISIAFYARSQAETTRANLYGERAGAEVGLQSAITQGAELFPHEDVSAWSFQYAVALDQKAGLSPRAVTLSAARRFRSYCLLLCGVEFRCTEVNREHLRPLFEWTLTRLESEFGNSKVNVSAPVLLAFSDAAWKTGADSRGDRLIPLMRASLAAPSLLAGGRHVDSLPTWRATFIRLLLVDAEREKQAGRASESERLALEAVEEARRCFAAPVDPLLGSLEARSTASTFEPAFRAFLFRARLRAAAGDRLETDRLLREAAVALDSLASDSASRLAEYRAEVEAVRSEPVRLGAGETKATSR